MHPSAQYLGLQRTRIFSCLPEQASTTPAARPVSPPRSPLTFRSALVSGSNLRRGSGVIRCSSLKLRHSSSCAHSTQSSSLSTGIAVRPSPATNSLQSLRPLRARIAALRQIHIMAAIFRATRLPCDSDSFSPATQKVLQITIASSALTCTARCTCYPRIPLKLPFRPRASYDHPSPCPERATVRTNAPVTHLGGCCTVRDQALPSAAFRFRQVLRSPLS